MNYENLLTSAGAMGAMALMMVAMFFVCNVQAETITDTQVIKHGSSVTRTERTTVYDPGEPTTTPRKMDTTQPVSGDTIAKPAANRVEMPSSQRVQMPKARQVVKQPPQD